MPKTRGGERPVRVVCLDAVGTLIRPDPPAQVVYAQAAERHGWDLDVAEIRRRFDRQLEEPAETTSSEAYERAYWKAFVEGVLGERSERTERVFEELWWHFAAPGNWRLCDDAAQAWSSLHAAGFQPAIASNFDQRLLGICSALPPLDTAERVFTSSEVGFRKSPPFYRAVAERLQVDAADCLMVGDDRQRDVEAARAAGWQAIWLDRRLAGAGHEDRSIRRIGDLRQLATGLAPA